jgi:hypothetical protein
MNVSNIQAKLDAIMKGRDACRGEEKDSVGDEGSAGLDLFQSEEQWKCLGLDDQELILRDSEQLQVHMDCVNAVGEVIAIEDVDDMGGSVRTSSIHSLYPCTCSSSVYWLHEFLV